MSFYVFQRDPYQKDVKYKSLVTSCEWKKSLLLQEITKVPSTNSGSKKTKQKRCTTNIDTYAYITEKSDKQHLLCMISRNKQ